MSDVATEAAGPSYDLRQVNVDSLKEVLNQLGLIFPFQDEGSKVAYHAQVNSLGSAGDPHATPEPSVEAAVETSTETTNELTAAQSKIAELEAQLAAAQATQVQGTANAPDASSTATDTATG